MTSLIGTGYHAEFYDDRATLADADDVVKSRSHWVTSKPGGRGAVREICDLVLAAQNLDGAALEGILKL